MVRGGGAIILMPKDGGGILLGSRGFSRGMGNNGENRTKVGRRNAGGGNFMRF